MITHEYAPFRGGIATYCEEVALAAHALGMKFEVWAPGTGKYAGATDCDSPFPVKRLAYGGRLTPTDLFRLMLEILRHRKLLDGATIYLPGIGSQIVFILLCAAGFFKKHLFVTTFHDVEPLRFGRNPLIRPLAPAFFKRAWKITTASKCAKERLAQSFMDNLAQRAAVAPCALKSGLKKAGGTLAAGREQSGTGKIKILTLARIHPRKGQLEVAHALGILPEETKKKIIWQLAGKGDGEYLREVLRIANENEVETELLGEISGDDMASVYAQCDIYAMTSREMRDSAEGFGMTYLEAAYFGKPTVGYRVGGVGEAVVDGQTGFLIEEGDRKGVAEAILRLANDPELRRKMGEAGKKHTGNFDWKKTAAILFE